MRSLRWVILTVVAVVALAVLAIAVGALWLNSFIHSPAFKAEVESRAAQALGGPVRIESIDFDILHGVKLQGVVAQVDAGHSGGQGALQVQMTSANCGISWSEIFQRRLQVTGVTLEQPQVVLTKQATAPLSPASSSPSTSTSPGSTSGSSLPFRVTLDRAIVRDGMFTIRDASGQSLVELRGIRASTYSAGLLEGKDVTGRFDASEVTTSRLKATLFVSTFTYSPAAVEVPHFQAVFCAGNVGGDYHLGGDGPSVLNLEGVGIDVPTLTAATTSSSTAKVFGSLNFQSKWRGVETGDLYGEGDAQINGCQLKGVRILDEAATLLKIKELNDPVITAVKTHFVVQNRQVKFIGLQLLTTVCQLTGDGVVDFDGKLHANLVLILGRDAMGRLPKEVAASFVQQQDGSGSISFEVSGTTDNPQTDLPVRLLMQNTQIKNVINKALNRFFH